MGVLLRVDPTFYLFQLRKTEINDGPNSLKSVGGGGDDLSNRVFPPTASNGFFFLCSFIFVLFVTFFIFNFLFVSLLPTAFYFFFSLGSLPRPNELRSARPRLHQHNPSFRQSFLIPFSYKRADSL